MRPVGVPDGWKGKSRRNRRLLLIQRAEQKAEQVMDKLIAQGRLDKDGAGNEVLKWATTVVLAKDPDTGMSCYTVKDQLNAAKMVLDFTMAKPESKTAVTVTPENFLQGLLAKEKTPKE